MLTALLISLGLCLIAAANNVGLRKELRGCRRKSDQYLNLLVNRNADAVHLEAQIKALGLIPKPRKTDAPRPDL